jgi:hypothetical protein
MQLFFPGDPLLFARLADSRPGLGPGAKLASFDWPWAEMQRCKRHAATGCMIAVSLQRERATEAR